jgi:hypothetical protein
MGRTERLMVEQQNESLEYVVIQLRGGQALEVEIAKSEMETLVGTVVIDAADAVRFKDQRTGRVHIIRAAAIDAVTVA